VSARESERERESREKVNRKRGGDERHSNSYTTLMNRIQLPSIQYCRREK